MSGIRTIRQVASSKSTRLTDERLQLAMVRCIADQLDQTLGETNPQLPSGVRSQLADELELLARALRANDHSPG